MQEKSQAGIEPEMLQSQGMEWILTTIGHAKAPVFVNFLSW